MSRYIDADRFKDTLEMASERMHLICGVKGVDIGAVIKAVDMFPTADVVEVVRCKDCIYYKSNCCFNRQWDFESSVEVPLVRENDYCSYGERSENGT